jgi:hypothetical protein
MHPQYAQILGSVSLAWQPEASHINMHSSREQDKEMVIRKAKKCCGTQNKKRLF